MYNNHAKAVHRVTVYNRSADKAARWDSQHARARAPTPAAAAKDKDLVLMCVGNDDDVRAVVLGENGALAAMRKGSTLVDHTTASADIAREIHAAAAAKGISFLDGPVSGGQAGAENGKLTIMVGGDSAAFDGAAPVLGHYARAVTLMGGPGSGQLTKMFNQICIAGLVQALAEGVAFAEKAGLDVERELDVISKGAAQSWQMENRGKTMLADKFDFGFAVDWMRKDLGLCMAEARARGATLPVTALVDQLYARVQAEGGGRFDSSSLIRNLRTKR